MAQIGQLADKNAIAIYPQTLTEAIIDSQQKLMFKEDGNKLQKQVDENSGKILGIQNMNTAWSPWSKDGMSLLNGAQMYNGDWDYPQYRTRKLNGVLQVEITFRIKGVTVEGDTPYVGYPSNLKPEFMSHHGYSFPTTNGRSASWVVGEGTIGLHATNDHNMDAGYWYPFYAQWEVQL